MFAYWSEEMMQKSTTPVIVSAVRTPVGKYGRALKDFTATDLGSRVVREAVVRATLNSESVDEVIMGQVLQAGVGQAPARQAAILAGLPVEIPALTVNKVCGSGLKAVMLAAQAVRAGDVEVVVAGGMESMSNVPYYLPKGRFGYFYGSGKVLDGVEYDGLLDAYNGVLMGMTGEIVAQRFGVSREQADNYALRSHQRAVTAAEQGFFDAELLPVETTDRKGQTTVISLDDGPRKDTSLELLSKLKPAFKKDGVVTAGNASSLNDGASAVVVVSARKAEELDLRPLAIISAYHSNGVKPDLVMEAPIHGVRHILDKTGLQVDDFDLFEHNEAFATASVAVQQELDIPEDKFNVNGGAIALGHPLGCSGARVLTTLVHELIRRKGHRGLATLCLGGGNAVTMIVERPE